jgi:hypothetical protein
VKWDKLDSLEELKRKARVELELYSTWKKTNTGSRSLMETTIQIGIFFIYLFNQQSEFTIIL